MPMRFGKGAQIDYSGAPSREFVSTRPTLILDRLPPAPAPAQRAAQELRSSILSRMPVTNAGRRRAYTEFRKKSGHPPSGAKGEWWQRDESPEASGITLPEFCRAVRAFSMRWDMSICRQVFAMLDTAGSGTISESEFLHFIEPTPRLLSLDPRDSVHLRRERPRTEGASPHSAAAEKTLIDKLHCHSRGRHPSGASVWRDFRIRCGVEDSRAGGADGSVDCDQFVVGCRSFGLALEPSVYREVFAAFGPDASGLLRMQSFTARLVSRAPHLGTGLPLGSNSQGPRPGRPIHLTHGALAGLLSTHGVTDDGELVFTAGQRVQRT